MSWGFHMQRTVPGWLQAVAKLPAGAPVKAVDDYHMLRDAKQANSAVYTVFRKWYDHAQTYDDAPMATKRQRARDYFNTFIDGTFRQIAQHVDAIGLWNEEYAASQTQVERQRRIDQDKAFLEVWVAEYHPEFPHIDIHLTSAAPGNSIPVGIAQLGHQYRKFPLSNAGAVLDYHAYTAVRDGQVVSGENIWCSGRWMVDDAAYRQAGYTVKWFLSEIGATGWNSGESLRNIDEGFFRGWEPPTIPEGYRGILAVAGHFDYGGWKDSNLYGGNLPNYLNSAVKDNLDRWGAWAAANPGRFKGGVGFTVNANADPRWLTYEMSGAQMATIADFVRTYNPSPPPPPPPPPANLEEQIWADSIARQIERGIPLNPDAGLQALIFARPGYTPVTREETVNVDNAAYGYMAGEHVGGGDVRRVWYFKKPWPGPGGVKMMVDPTTFLLDVYPVKDTPPLVTSDWNAPRDYDGDGVFDDFHEGLDLRVIKPNGGIADIIAAKAGVVDGLRLADPGTGYGIYVRIKHVFVSGGVVTTYYIWYAHLASVTSGLSIGQLVSAGTILGRAGATGNAAGHHLHLTVQKVPGGSSGYVIASVINPRQVMGHLL